MPIMYQVLGQTQVTGTGAVETWPVLGAHILTGGRCWHVYLHVVISLK